MRSWSWIDRILLGIAILIVLGCCWALGYKVTSSVYVYGFRNSVQQDPLSNPRVVALLHLPAYQLAYPGAVLLRQFAEPPGQGEGGPNPAEVSKTFGIAAPVPAQVSGQAILDWYDEQLQAQGWTPTTSGGIQSTYSLEMDWSNSPYHLIVGIYDPRAIQDYEMPIDTTKYPLAFQLSILG